MTPVLSITEPRINVQLDATPLMGVPMTYLDRLRNTVVFQIFENERRKDAQELYFFTLVRNSKIPAYVVLLEFLKGRDEALGTYDVLRLGHVLGIAPMHLELKADGSLVVVSEGCGTSPLQRSDIADIFDELQPVDLTGLPCIVKAPFIIFTDEFIQELRNAIRQDKSALKECVAPYQGADHVELVQRTWDLHLPLFNVVCPMTRFVRGRHELDCFELCAVAQHYDLDFELAYCRVKKADFLENASLLEGDDFRAVA